MANKKNKRKAKKDETVNLGFRRKGQVLGRRKLTPASRAKHPVVFMGYNPIIPTFYD